MRSEISQSRIRLRTLGRFQLEVDGRVIRLLGTKSKALVAYLAVNAGRRYTRDFLADLLWPRSPENRARHSLNQTLYAIRRLVPDLIADESPFLACHAGVVTTDVEQLHGISDSRAIGPVVSLLTGNFLEDVTIGDANDFEEWKAATQRDTANRADHLLSQHLNTLNAAERRQWVTNNPGIADLCPSVAKALAVDCQHINPLDEIKANDVGAVHSDGNDTRPGLLPIVRREEQLQQLDAAFMAAKMSEPQFVIVHGMAGVGKSTLVQGFLDEHAQLTRVLRVKCYETEKRIGLAPIVDLLVRNLTTTDVATLDGVWVDALTQIAPTLQTDPGRTPPVLSDAAAQTRLFEAVLRTLTHLGSVQPTVIFIDDVQWADRSTKALLSYVAHRLRDTRLLLIACARTRRPAAAFRPPWSEWTKIAVRPFDDSEIKSLVDAVSGQANFTRIPQTEEIQRLTGGNPYYTTEVIRACLSGQDVSAWRKAAIARNTNHVLVREFHSLDAETQRVLSFMAVLGRPISPLGLRKISRSASISRSLTRLKQLGMISESRSLISLSHDLVREAVYNQIPLFSRTEIHGRVAEVMRKKHPGAAAEHYYQAGQKQLAHRYALKATQEADARYANDASISFLKLAIRAATGDAFSLRWTLAQRLFRAGNFKAAKYEAEQLLKIPAAGQRAEFAAILVFRILISYETSELSGLALREQLREARKYVRSDDSATLIRLLRLRARAAFHDGDFHDIPGVIEELRIVGANITSDDGLAAVAYAARVHAAASSAIEAMAWAAPLFERAETVADPELRLEIKHTLAGIAYDAGDLRLAAEISKSVLDEVERLGMIRNWPIAAVHSHMFALEQGDYRQATTLFDQIISREPEFNARYELVAAHANHALMYYEMGEYESAYKEALKAREYFVVNGSVWVAIGVKAIAGLAALRLGRLAEATKLTAETEHGLANTGGRGSDMSYANILIAQVHEIHGRRAEAEQHILSALQQCQHRDPIARMRLQLYLARLKAKQDRQEARHIARTVYEKATACGARPLADRADELLHRL